MRPPALVKPGIRSPRRHRAAGQQHETAQAARAGGSRNTDMQKNNETPLLLPRPPPLCRLSQ
eukprot:15471555-Alexandrium_andersonii.AAC.1